MSELATVLPLPERSALLGRNERFRQPGRFGNMSAGQLTAILQQLERGEVSEWADLCQFALKTDDLLISLYETRINRVSQADYQIVPNEFGNPRQAELAAEFINEMLGRVENWESFVKKALHAIALGFSANEIEWDHDAVNRVNYIRHLHYINPNRFRYDEQWKLRLYDHGSRARYPQGAYGEVLWPGGWVIHHHYALAGDPCDAGIMRMSIWRWLFRRWADTFWIQNLEKHGAPFVTAKVAPGTPDAVRQSIKAALEDMSLDRAAIFEMGGEIVVTPAAMGAGSESQHQLYMDFGARSLTTTWLGASDITQPGVNGSQSAVDTRASVTLDPRMISDGMCFAGTLHAQMFRWLIHYNLHKFGAVPPIPRLALKTASDEVELDQQDLAEQNAVDVADGKLGTLPPGQQSVQPYEVRGDDGSPTLDQTLALPSGEPSGEPSDDPSETNGGEPSVPPPAVDGAAVDGAPVAEKAADTALNSAQVSSLLEVITAVAEGQLPRESAVAIIEVAFNLPTATADRMMGAVGKGFTPEPEAPAASPYGGAPKPAAKPDAPPAPDTPVEAADPKVLGRSTQGRRTTPSATNKKKTTSARSRAKTSQTGSPSIGPLETVLRNMSADRPR